MARRRRRQHDLEQDRLEAISDLAAGIIGIGVLYLASDYFLNRDRFWREITWTGVVVVILIAILLGIMVLRDRLSHKRFDNLLERVAKLGLQNDINNFILRFGLGKAKRSDWKYRDYSFEPERLNDFLLGHKELNINESELRQLLEYFIQNKEVELTMQSVAAKTNASFSSLSGSDFEKLLVRLWEAMGYKVQLIGQVGDQGGDLIANRDNERLLIQAKRYTGLVGNDAIQEAFTAKKHYDCTAAAVVTTSYFTREAYALAKTTEVKLYGYKMLEEMLLQYLHEKWHR